MDRQWIRSESEIVGREFSRARGLAGRRLLCTQEIAGSNPAGSTNGIFSVVKGSDSPSLPFALPRGYQGRGALCPTCARGFVPRRSRAVGAEIGQRFAVVSEREG